jgi:hypothetical protein
MLQRLKGILRIKGFLGLILSLNQTSDRKNIIHHTSASGKENHLNLFEHAIIHQQKRRKIYNETT